MLALTIAATIHISVLGSFHPVQFELKPTNGQTLVVESAGRSEIVQGERTVPLYGPAKVAGRNGAPVRFRLGIPGGVSREYIGKLEVRRLGVELLAIVEMNREDAVAAIVQAIEQPVAELYTNPRPAAAIVQRYFQDVGAFERDAAARG